MKNLLYIFVIDAITVLASDTMSEYLILKWRFTKSSLEQIIVQSASQTHHIKR